MNSASASAESQLKRLGFVHTGTTYAYTEAEKLYKTVRAYTPQFAQPSLGAVEDRTASALAPVVAKAQDLGDKLLCFADKKVDYVVTASRQLNDNNMKTFSAALDSYFTYMSKMSDYVVEQLHMKSVQAATVNGVQSARDKLVAAVQKAREATDPDVAVQLAWDAWSAFAAHPAVARVLTTAEPATKMGQQAFVKLHNTLVATPLYKVVIDRTACTINYAASTTPYKLGAQYLYPIVQPVADPALNKVANSKVINQVVDYWRPVTAAVAAH